MTERSDETTEAATGAVALAPALTAIHADAEQVLVELLRGFDADLDALESEVARARRRLSVVRALLGSRSSRRGGDEGPGQ